MTEPTLFVARGHSVPSDSTPGPGTFELGEMAEGSAPRPATYCLVWLILWSLGILLNNLVAPLLEIPVDQVIPWNREANVAAAIGIALSLLLYREARRPGTDEHRLLKLAIGYQLLTALAVGIVNQTVPERILAGRLSWICVLVLVFPLIVPTPPKTTLWTSLLAASADPVGILLAYSMGKPVPNIDLIFWAYLPNYVCALLAIVPAGILTRLSRQVRKARELGSYRLDALIGRGGMGEVWRASHRMLARPAAIKLIRPEALGASGDSDRNMIRRFRREAEAVASLHSQHTVKLYDFGVNREGTLYFVMELLHGVDLESMVRRFGPVPAERAAHFLNQACHSLAEAHAAGLVHRDIKPSNLFACRMGLDFDFLKVLDFGLVKSARRSVERTLQTAPELTTGTPAYMAPELVLGEGDVGPGADIYALGCVAFFLLTGHLVFEADTPLKMIVRHLQDAPPTPSTQVEGNIPPALDELILACLCKKPEQRPTDSLTIARCLSKMDFAATWTDDRARHWWGAYRPDTPGQPEVIPGAGTHRMAVASD